MSARLIAVLLWAVILDVHALEQAIPNYPDAQPIERNALASKEYRVITSAPKRINNAMRIESQARFKGAGQSELLRLSEAASIEEVYRFYLGFFEAQGAIAYQCEQRNCGNSSFWANEEFNDRRLYGRDSDQYYLVGRVDAGKQQHWVQIYIVLNGRKDAYVFVRQLVAESTLSIDDFQSGFVLPDDVELDVATAAQLAQWLVADEQRVLWLVCAQAYASSVSGVDVRNQTRIAAESLADKLAEKLGVARTKIKTEARGDLAQRPLGVTTSRWFVLYLR